MAAKPKPEIDTRTQRQKFIDKARELGTDESPEVFERTIKAIALAPKPEPKAAPAKAKAGSKKRKI